VRSSTGWGVALLLLGAVAPVEGQLLDAARSGDHAAVMASIALNADVSAARGDGMTALHLAAEGGHTDVVAALVSAGATVDPGTRIGSYTPLHLAARSARTETVEFLLEAGANPNATTTTSGVSPLHLAAAAIGGEGAVGALLEHGANPNALEASVGQTALMFAAAENHGEAIGKLLRAGADPDIRTEVVDVLYSLARDRTASLKLTQTIDSIEVAEHGGQDWRPTPAQVAEAIQAQRAFVESRPDVGPYDPASLANVRPDYPGGPEVVRLPFTETLVGATGGMTALLYAAREGHVEAAMALVGGGADLDLVSGGDQTSALLIATMNGQYDLALRLIELGANPNLAASTDGATPVFATLQTQWAPRSNYPQPRAQDTQQAEYMDVLRALLAAGADPNVALNTHLWYWEYGLNKMGVDLTGATPFWRAAFAQDLGAMRLLVAHGAEPDTWTRWPAIGMRERRQTDGRQQEDSGVTLMPEGTPNAWAIHAAAGGGYLGLGAFSVRNVPNQFLPAVQYMVEELGADVNERDGWGYTPMHYAAARGDNELILYLVEQGADVQAVTRLGQTTVDITRGGRSGFFQRVPFPETEELLLSLGAVPQCLHTHFLDTGDWCPASGVPLFSVLAEDAAEYFRRGGF
jgi:ankyrin repeat protein